MSTIELPVLMPPITVALVELSECVCEQLTETGAGPLCWCGVYPGQTIEWDGCSDCGNEVCGMGWVRLDVIAPYEIFPTPQVDLRCTLPLAWRVEVGALRCMPLNEDGSMLSPQRATEVALGLSLDAAALHRALICCDGVQAAPELYQPLGPSGGCVGGAWSAYLVFD